MKISVPENSNKIIDVSTGEVKSAKAPALLQCLALGSCVAVILYDEKQKIGGIAHIMLPPSANENVKGEDLLKHADYAISELIKQVKGLGANEDNLTARMVGGALVVPDEPDIGQENIAAARNILRGLDIKILGEHLGGNSGRSVLFNVADGGLEVNGKVFPTDTTKPFTKEENKLRNETVFEHAKEVETKVDEKTEKLDGHIKDLEDARKATLNLLEDLEKEKEKTETAKIRLEFATRSANIGVWDWDIVKNNIVWDDNMFKLYGISRTAQTVAYNVWQNGLHPDDMKETVKLLNDAVEGKAEYNTKFRVIWPDKSIHDIRAFGMVVKDKNGKPANMVGVNFDITKESEMEKMRIDFLSLASHQLRTPLSGTKWLIETMQRGITGKIEPKEKEYLDSLYQMNERMIKLVFDMLSVLRLESGSETIKTETISADSILKDTISLMSAPAKSKGVILSHACKNAKSIKFETDVQLLKTILECFVSNAINYTPAGKEVLLTLGDSPKEAPDSFVFSVKDNGIGIPEEEQPKIFERFYRASNAKILKPDGTGLGLYIAKILAEKIGARVYFESKNGKGSTFHLNIPKKAVK